MQKTFFLSADPAVPDLLYGLTYFRYLCAVKNEDRLNRSRQIFDIWLIVVVMMYVAIFALTPMCVDDYFYSFHSASLTSPFDKAAAIWQNCWDRWHYDTGRLCNLMSPVFLGLLPKIVFSIISGFFIWMSVRLMCRLAEVRRGSTGSWVILFLVNFALPWFEHMFTVIFALNYVWPSALSLLFVYWMLNFNAVVEKQSTSRFVIMCGIALLAGWMHEGFSVPVIAGLTATWALTRHRPAKREFVLFLCFVVGFLLIVASPALWYRTENMVPYFRFLSLGRKIFYGIGCNSLFFGLCLFLIYLVFRRRMKKLFVDAPNIRPLIIFILASSIAATALFFKFYTGPRMAWYATQLCSIGFVAVGNKVFRPVKRSVGHILKSAIVFLVFFNLIFAVVEQNKLYNESEEIVRLFLDSPNGDVFYDNIPRYISPSLYKTSIRYFNMERLDFFSHYWRENDDVMLTLLPTRLKNFEPASATSCRSDSTLFIKDGLLVARESAVAGKDRIWIETTETGWTETTIHRKFFSAADNSRWALIDPYISSLGGFHVTDARWKE